MDITTFLAQLWGPALLAVGVGVLTSRNYYVRVYRELEKNALTVLLFGMVLMTAGITSVLFHNTWGDLSQVIISILGWGTLAKGVLFIVAPGFVDRAGDEWANLKLIPAAGGLMLVLGGYLLWVGYLVA